MQRVDAFWDKGIARGKTTVEQKQEWSKNLHAESNLEKAVKDCDLIIEAVPEILELKQQIFQEVEQYANQNAVFATNTSSLSIGKLLERLIDQND